MDPKNNDAYLQAYARMGTDEIDHALTDYRMYNANEPVSSSMSFYDSVDFGIEFVKAFPKGAVESGRQLVSSQLPWQLIQ